MFVLFKKEISSFFSSLIGYIVIIVFLIINGLFLWVFPGEFNILDSGYSSIESLFVISPWVFLFLVPAITMRLIADEKKSGTIELLYTRPITDFQIIFAKYAAGVVLVLLSLIPTLIYFVTVYFIGNPVGNIDTGASWGSYIGLFFLAGVYASIGIFASSLTQNQIISFIIAMLLSFFFYVGFDSISSLDFFRNIEGVILNLGIMEHYKSISRGVVDTRDIIYFVSIITGFLFLTKLILESRKW